MTPKQPPKIATWMLKHFGCGANNDVVLGDLEEQYQKNKSAVWYWRQVLKAIPVSLFKELRDHAWIAAASVMTGWVLWYLSVVTIFSGLSNFFFGMGMGVDIEPSHPIGTAWSILWAPVGIPAGVNQPFSYVYSILLPLIVWAICAWMVRASAGVYFDRLEDGNLEGTRLSIRIHGNRQNGVVLLFAASTLLLNLLLIGPFILNYQQYALGPSTAWLYSYVGHLAMNVTASMVGILIGGGLLRDRSTIGS
jgi:hypothetical protein